VISFHVTLYYNLFMEGLKKRLGFIHDYYGFKV